MGTKDGQEAEMCCTRYNHTVQQSDIISSWYLVVVTVNEICKAQLQRCSPDAQMDLSFSKRHPSVSYIP